MVLCDICKQLLDKHDFLRYNELGYSLDQICIVCRLNGKTTEKKITPMYYSGIWCSYRRFPTKKLCGDPECSVCFADSFASFQGKTPFGKLKTECWDTSKNGEIVPSMISHKTGRRFWFQCDNPGCEHSFKSVLSRITSKSPEWCPYCNITADAMIYTDLQIHFPDLETSYSPKWGWSHFKSVFNFYIPSLKLIVDIDTRTRTDISDISKWTSIKETSTHEIFKLEMARSRGISVIRLLQEDVLCEMFNWRTCLEAKLKSGCYPNSSSPSICMITNGGEFPASAQDDGKLESNDELGYSSCDDEDEDQVCRLREENEFGYSSCDDEDIYEARLLLKENGVKDDIFP